MPAMTWDALTENGKNEWTRNRLRNAARAALSATEAAKRGSP